MVETTETRYKAAKGSGRKGDCVDYQATGADRECIAGNNVDKSTFVTGVIKFVSRPLYNKENSCFFNVVMQYLFHIKEIRDHLAGRMAASGTWVRRLQEIYLFYRKENRGREGIAQYAELYHEYAKKLELERGDNRMQRKYCKIS